MIPKVKKLLKFKPKSLKYIQASYSQFGEDFFLREYFVGQKNGTYVDIGAYHPYQFSNTYYLRSQLGWKGINIEPQPANFEYLKKETDDININCAISDQEGKVSFKLSGVCSSITEDKDHPDVITVESRQLKDILKEHHFKNIDFMSVDCEGYDVASLKTNDWDLYRPKLIAVEDHAGAVGSDVDVYMESINYRLVSWYHLTKFYADRGEESECLNV